MASSLLGLLCCRCCRPGRTQGGAVGHGHQLTLLREGAAFQRSVRRMIFTSKERVAVKLDPEIDTVLLWAREMEASRGSEVGEWQEVDMTSVKAIEPRGDLGFALVSRTEEIVLELEAEDEGVRDEWQAALTHLLCFLKDNPQDAAARVSLRDQLKHSAQRQAYFARRSLELQQKKRTAEERKARYLEGAGGLKYTALAMANRGEP